jgi:hypothetical protein
MFVVHLLSLNFVFQTNASVNAVHLLFTSGQPVNLSRSFFKEYNGTHSGEAVKLSWVPSNCSHLLLLPKPV